MFTNKTKSPKCGGFKTDYTVDNIIIENKKKLKIEKITVSFPCLQT